jgi:hypothetical protein
MRGTTTSGIDNRAAGQTAAYPDRPRPWCPSEPGRGCGGRHAPSAAMKTARSGFRTGLRAHFPKVVLAGEARGEDSAELTFPRCHARCCRTIPRSVRDLQCGWREPGADGGAPRDAGRADDVIVVGHDVNFVTAPLLRDRLLDCVLASDPARPARYSARGARCHCPRRALRRSPGLSISGCTRVSTCRDLRSEGLDSALCRHYVVTVRVMILAALADVYAEVQAQCSQ